MHCPQCGQEQISGEVSFCKSCGFALDGVKELLGTDGVSPAIRRQSQKALQSPRRNGVRQGVILLCLSMVFMPLTILFGTKRGEFLPMMFLMAGLMRILYACIFQEGAPKKEQDSSQPDYGPIVTNQLDTATRGPALPPSRSVPITAFNARRVETAEMVNRPSVTEHTTKLLDQSQDPE